MGRIRQEVDKYRHKRGQIGEKVEEFLRSYQRTSFVCIRRYVIQQQLPAAEVGEAYAVNYRRDKRIDEALRRGEGIRHDIKQY